MSCKYLLVAACVLVGCAAETAITTEVAGRARMPMVLAPAVDEITPPDATSYRWELLVAPDASVAASLESGEVTTTFVPDVRGAYVVERWSAYGVSEELTHRFVIDALGLAPISIARGTADVTIGAPAMLDGATSRSDEGLPLTYQWRLVERPRGSATMLVDAHAVTSSLTPDVAGGYTVELAVFDGVLWSELEARFVVRAAPL